MNIALVGQPNSGKSTLFNAVVGYKSLTSNFAGTTVEYTRGQARVNGDIINLIDLPGLYSLNSSSPVEAVSRDFLLAEPWDVLINVLDASQLARSLELTLELLDLEAPLVLCLNMMDEAARKGMAIDSAVLAAELGVPVVEATASRGRGIVETLRIALATARDAAGRAAPLLGAPRAGLYAVNVAKGVSPRPFVYAPEVESTIQRLIPKLAPSHMDSPLVDPGESSSPRASGAMLPAQSKVSAVGLLESSPAAERPATFPPARFEVLHLLESDPREAARREPAKARLIASALEEIARRQGKPADVVISSARHAACLNLFERAARVERPRRDWREGVDRLVMHPLWGYAVLALVFLGFFQLIFTVGKFSESRVLAVFDALVAAMAQHMNTQGVAFAVAKGAVLGTAGAVAIVLPYLLPFLIGLAILEDLGYLSRVGYLMDAAMHRLGLHGTATLPVLLGYGCSVPAVMATRILHSRRDRFIAAFLAVLVPCSARMTVILALVGFYLGANYALGIYALNLLVVMLAGHTLARLWPEISPGMLMEVPAYRVPTPRVVLLKTWWRLREFVVVAFPLLVVGSAVLSLIEFYGWQQAINAALSPLTALLGLPRATGLTLIFGVLRKELSLLMLVQALGTTHVLTVMSVAQLVIFTLFVTFYLPCLATLASMLRELGWRLTTAAAATLLVIALIVSLAARGILAVF
ncbi:MAG: ferrous iron transport protein B [Acidobacteriia bacterium]|nr:ferrous iron transport protein B [Terriglobia bacterium]